MLAADGFDDFTMAAVVAVAERSGSGLADVVGAYAHGLADTLDANRAFFPDLMIPRSAAMAMAYLQPGQ